MSSPNGKPSYQSEGALILKELLEQQGITPEAYETLPTDKKREIMGKVRELLKPVLGEVIGETEGKRELTAEKANLVRQKLGTEKWHKLSEVVSYIKTLLGDTLDEKRSETYNRHLALGVDANELKHTLSVINDVYPARIDTDIKHQSSLYYRAVVELISNALDASITKRSPIGRFGVGFYQILNHLKTPEDRVIVTTKTADAEQGIRIEFRLRGGEVDFRITPDSSIANQGTAVELRSKEFKGKKAEAIVKEYFTHTQDIRVDLNGSLVEQWKPDNPDRNSEDAPIVQVHVENGRCIVSDNGKGMGTKTVFEKLLVPKLSDKPPVYELREKGQLKPELHYGLGANKAGKAIVQVGGIMVETMKVEGANTAETVVINLPPSTILGEQRDEVDIDANTVAAMKEVVDMAVSLPKPQCFAVLNVLGTVCRDFQNRSKLAGKGDNVFVYLQRRIRETHSNMFFLPNKAEFMELDLPEDKVAYLDPAIHQTAPRSVEGLRDMPGWVSSRNVPLFQAPFKAGSKLGFINGRSFLIVDERAKPETQAALFNKIIQLAAGHSVGTLRPEAAIAQQKIEHRTELKEHSSLSDLAAERWNDLYFGSAETAKSQSAHLEKRKPKIVSLFTRRILSRLPSAAGKEAWDVMEWFVMADTRSEDEQIRSIEAVGKNLDVLLANPTIREVLFTNMVPLFSLFEPIRADVPAHLRERWGSIQGTATIDAKQFYVVGKKEDDYGRDKDNRRLFLAEDGETVYMPGNEGILFKNKDLTVYRDKIIDTKTQQPIPIQLPASTWGSLTFDFAANIGKVDRWEKKEERRSSRDDKYYPRLKNEVTDADGVTYKIDGYSFYINGKKQEKFGGVDVECKEVLLTSSGQVRILAYQGSPYRDYNGGGRHGDDDEKSSEFYIFKGNGEVVWKYDSGQYGEKVIKEPGRGKDAYSLRGDANRCILMPHGDVIEDAQPLVRVARYILTKESFLRDTQCYVDGNGQVTNMANTNAVNPLTLQARFAWESRCPCCSGNRFEIGEYHSPFDRETGEYNDFFTVRMERLPVKVVGTFSYDSDANEWRAPAISWKEDNDKFFVVCSEQGEFLRVERLGSDWPHPSRLAPKGDILDLRDQTQYYVNRLPIGLRQTKESNSAAGYKQIMAGRVRQNGRTVLLKPTGYSNMEEAYQERDGFADGLFSADAPCLTAEHSEILASFLANKPIPATEKLERLFYRVLQYRAIPASDMEAFLPVFYEMEDLNPALFVPEVTAQMKKIAGLDEERFLQFIRLLHRCIPEDVNEAKRIVARLSKFYSEKLQNESLQTAEEMIRALSNVREYDGCVICDGFTMIRNRTSVPSHELDRRLRPLITFMLREDEELASAAAPSNEVIDEPARTMRLSELIQWKRLREKEARTFSGDTAELATKVQGACEGKRREHIVREVTHAIHFQALNSTDLYLRELVQNAVDALRSTEAPAEQRNVHARVFIENGTDLSLEFEDPVGMDGQTLINYFLVPGETTKADKEKKYIGFYGQGVYTLFKDAKEVSVKTGIGDGRTWYLTMRPVIEHGLIADVEIDFRCIREKFKGTTIRKTQATENPYVEAAYIRDSMQTLTSALSDEKAAVYLQGEKINAHYRQLHRESLNGLGEVTIYRNPNNIVTQHGLYVKDLGDEYLGGLPAFVTKVMKDTGGIVIDLPPEVALTRSRQDIANKDKVDPILKPAVLRGLLQSYLKYVAEHLEENPALFPFDQLPYDYFVNDTYSVPHHYHSDAEALLHGQSLQHVEEYLQGRNCVKFMSLMPLFKVGERMMALESVRAAYHTKPKSYPFDQEEYGNLLPRRLYHLLSEQEEKFRDQNRPPRPDEIVIHDCSLEELIEQAPEKLKEWLLQNRAKIEALGATTRSFMDTLAPVYFNGSAASNTFYYDERGGSTAHASRSFGLIGWNLHNKSPLYTLGHSFDGEKPEDRVGSLLEIIDTLAHEYVHTIEGHSEWTHDKTMELEQARVLIQFMIVNGMDKVMQALQPHAAAFAKPKKEK